MRKKSVLKTCTGKLDSVPRKLSRREPKLQDGFIGVIRHIEKRGRFKEYKSIDELRAVVEHA